MTDNTENEPFRRRGVVQLHEQILAGMLTLPPGQRIIGFRADPVRLTIEVCVEGEGLPDCAPGTHPYVVNAEPYTARYSPWALRGRELDELIRAELAAPSHLAAPLADRIRAVLDGTPR